MRESGAVPTPRSECIRIARVMLAECSRRRRGHANRDFYWQLFGGAL